MRPKRDLTSQIEELSVPEPETPEQLQSAVESFDEMARVLGEALAGAQG